MFRERLDEASKSLAQGVSRRAVVGGLVSGAVLGWLRPVRAMAQFGASCYTACKAQCTGADGSLNMVCFRSCVNSDPLNCGRCGNVCGPGQMCSQGECVQASSDITRASLSAAFAQIEQGVRDVAFNASGTTRYTQQFQGDVLVSSQFMYLGAVVITTTYTDGMTTTLRDSDLDGFPESRRTETRTSESRLVVLEDYLPATRQLYSRRTYTTSASGEDVSVGIAKPDGTLAYTTTHSEYPLTYGQAAPDPNAPCISCGSQQQLSDAITTATFQGNLCFASRGADGLGQDLLNSVASAKAAGLTISCKDPSYLPNTDWAAHTTILRDGNSRVPISIELNNAVFPTLPCDIQLSTVFHELLHLQMDHDRADDNSSAFLETDPVTACQYMCFGLPIDDKGTPVTQCECTACLRTSYCDSRCSDTAGCLNPSARPDICEDGCSDGACKPKPWHCDANGECHFNCPNPNEAVVNGVCTTNTGCSPGWLACPEPDGSIACCNGPGNVVCTIQRGVAECCSAGATSCCGSNCDQYPGVCINSSCHYDSIGDCICTPPVF